MQRAKIWTWMLVVALVLPGPALPIQTAATQAQVMAAPAQDVTVPAERMVGSTAMPSAIRHPQSAIQQTGVYTETFTTYAAKDYTDNTDWDIWAHELRLARTDVISQQSPAVAVDPSGDNTFVVWGDYRNGNWDIYAQKLDANGNKLWPEDVRVNSDSGTANQADPAVAVDGSGNAIIVWRGNSNIYAQKLDANGNKAWAEDVRVDSGYGGINPAVAVGPSDDNAIIVWCEYRNSNYGVYAQKLDANKNKVWSGDKRVDSGSGTAYQMAPAVAVDGNDDALVVWNDHRNGNFDIYAQKLGTTGNKRWEMDVRVNTDTGTEEQGNPAVAVDGSGNAFIVWNDYRNSNYDIYAQKVDTNGNKVWATDARINTDTGTASQAYPAVAVNPSDGNASVVWQDSRSGNGDIYAQKLYADGNKAWGDEDVRINSDSGTASQSSPAVAIDFSSGSALAVWQDYRNVVNNNSNYDIYAQKVDANGNKLLGADVLVNSNIGTANQQSPAVAVDLSSGNALVIWQDDRNVNWDVYAQMLDANGNRAGTTGVRVNSDSGTANQQSPAVAMDTFGRNAFVVWSDDRNGSCGYAGGNCDVYAQKVDAHGNKAWAADVRVNSDNGRAYQGNPAVAVDPTGGNAFVVWQDYRDGHYDIYAQKLDANGNKWKKDVRVNSDSGTTDQQFPAVAVDGSGDALIVWQDGRHKNSNDSNWDIYAQKVDANGNRAGTEDVRVNLDNSTAGQYDPAVAADPISGNAFVVWEDYRDSRYGYDIYAQKLALDWTRWATDTRVNSDGWSVGQSDPAVAVDPMGGNVFFAWRDPRNDAGDIYTQMLDPNRNKLWVADVRVNSDSGTSEQSYPAVAVDGNGDALVIWTDARNYYYDIYAQKIISPTDDTRWETDLQVMYPDIFYFPTGTAQSRAIDTVTGVISRATLIADYAPNGGSVQFYLTNDGGANWLAATPGVATLFTTSGSDLRWRAVLTRDPFWSRTPVISSLRIEYSAQASIADAYEPDDTCAQARPIAVNGAVQAHTFHQNADADWVWFNVVSGTTYIIQTSNPQTKADTVLELRRTCPEPPLETDDNAFGQDASITWAATFTGIVYAKASNHTPSVFGPDTGYYLSVRAVSQRPVAVIVAGHDNGNTLQGNINNAAEMAYSTFVNCGVPPANVRYLGPIVPGGNPHITAPATITNVQDAIEVWAPARGVGSGVPFFVYLADHGHYDQFLADGTSGKVFAERLNRWLSNLEETRGADNINVIIEACRSGSFIDVTSLGPLEISEPNRVVIASTSSALNSYPSVRGAYFSDVFWTELGQNKDLKTAFDLAKRAVRATDLSQEPWLDDNGDAVADERDGLLASGRGCGIPFAGSPPVIDWVQVGPVVNGRASVQAQVRDDHGVSEVWTVVYPPGFVEPPPTQDGTTPELNVPTVTLQLASGQVFSTTYSGFTQAGRYRLVVYAQDADGNQALPMTAPVAWGNFVYLPMMLSQNP